jgi:hypothetical protein
MAGSIIELDAVALAAKIAIFLEERIYRVQYSRKENPGIGVALVSAQQETFTSAAFWMC